MTIRTRYLTLAAVSISASVSALLATGFTFGFVFHELEFGLRFGLVMPFLAALWLIWTAVRFYRKAETEFAIEEVNPQGSTELQYVHE
jgi:membrane protein DedA with SNARE-associated domain